MLKESLRTGRNSFRNRIELVTTPETFYVGNKRMVETPYWVKNYE